MSPFVCVAILLLALVSPSPAAASIPGTSNNGAAVAAPSVPTVTQFLQAHNDARREVGVAPLTWNSTLEQDAERYAGRLGIRCKLEPLNGYNDGAAVTGSWVYERQSYDHRANTCAPGKVCGSYTQVVWNTTRELGCARRTCRSSRDTVAVCRYFPPGNYRGVPPY
nr:pathogenesis-related protein PRMS-like [Aegilops tauschii subsp. strangulata]